MVYNKEIEESIEKIVLFIGKESGFIYIEKRNDKIKI